MTVDENTTGRLARDGGPAWPADAGRMWSGVPYRTITEMVAAALSSRPEMVALAFEDGVEVTRGELGAAVSSFGGYVAGRISPGDRVAVAIGNRAEFFVAWLGVLAAGGVVVQMNPGAGPHDARHLLNDSGARVVVADAGALAALGQVLPECPEVTELLAVDDSAAEPTGLGRYDGEPLDLTTLRSAPDDPASIYYTSGTTGAPKGCISSQAGLARYVDVVTRLYHPAVGDRLFNPLQFFYGDAIWLFLTALCARTRMISLRRFSVSRFWPAVQSSGATVLLGIGAIPSLLLTAKPSAAERDHAVRMALQIGVPAQQHAELVERFGFPWIELYGQAESGLTIGMPSAHAAEYVGTGAIGIPIPEVELRVLGPEGDELTGEATGELQVRAPHMMREYLGRPDATAQTLSPEGWLRTGDRVRRDADGVHYFLGRTKELIRRGGENIAPFEVESVLRLHPLVVDAAVVPVADVLRGEEVKAYVELTAEADLHPQQLVDFCAGHLARHKVPRYWELDTRPFPRTPSQRIRKSELQIRGEHRTDTAWDREAQA